MSATRLSEEPRVGGLGCPKQATMSLMLVKGCELVKAFPQMPPQPLPPAGTTKLAGAMVSGMESRSPNSIPKVSHHPSGFQCRVHTEGDGGVEY